MSILGSPPPKQPTFICHNGACRSRRIEWFTWFDAPLAAHWVTARCLDCGAFAIQTVGLTKEYVEDVALW